MMQRGIVMNACHFAAEVLDVEGGGVSEEAAKLIAREIVRAAYFVTGCVNFTSILNASSGMKWIRKVFSWSSKYPAELPGLPPRRKIGR